MSFSFQFSLKHLRCLHALSMLFSTSFCCLNFSLHLCRDCPAFTTLQENWCHITDKGALFFVSYEIFPFLNTLFSFSKASFPITERLRISVPYFLTSTYHSDKPRNTKTLRIYTFIHYTIAVGRENPLDLILWNRFPFTVWIYSYDQQIRHLIHDKITQPVRICTRAGTESSPSVWERRWW